MPGGDDVAQTIEAVFRESSARIIAGLVRISRDFDLAEDAVQDAFAEAAAHWPVDGIPPNPGGWIATTARRKAIDRLRRETLFGQKLAVLQRLDSEEPFETYEPPNDYSIQDDRLRLIFTCCHPALALESQVALTLRTVCGLSTPEVARAFLLPEATLAQRIVRTKRKIRDAGIPYAVPPDHLLPERLAGVLLVIYLIYTEGYAPTAGHALQRRKLAAEAVRLARLLAQLMPDEPEAHGLLALLLLHDARRNARESPSGDLVLLEDQDRGLWDRAQIREGTGILDSAITRRRGGPYQVQAAIAALHCEAESAATTDWPQIALLYGRLMQLSPSPVVEVNRAVAVAMAGSPEDGLKLLNRLALDDAMQRFGPYHAARADLLRRSGRPAEAAAAYARAAELTANAERRYLERRGDEMGMVALRSI